MKLLAMLCAFALAVAGGGDDKDKTVVAVKLRHAASVRGHVESLTAKDAPG